MDNEVALREINAKIDNMQAQQLRILHYLHNDNGTGKLGLVADFEQHKNHVNNWITNQETKEAVTKARVSLIATIGGFIGAAILKIGTFFYTHNQ